jgi:hypothetical protein
MPFWMTNALATFQSCMKHIFNKKLRKLLLMFFDDIPIYHKTWEEHLKVNKILTITAEQLLFSKEEKCEFGLIEILYPRHVIGIDGVNVH